MKVELTSLITVPVKWHKRVAKFEPDWFKSVKDDANSMKELADFIERYTDDLFYGKPFRLSEDIYNEIYDMLTDNSYVVVGRIPKVETKSTVGAIAVITDGEVVYEKSENDKDQI